MRILIADDHAILRSGLHRLLKDAYPQAEIGEVSNADELNRMILQHRWSLLILDIGLGNQNGLELLPVVHKKYPHMSVMVLSMHRERPFVISALRNGAKAYLTKDRAPEELLRAVEIVLKGQRYIDETIVSQLADFVALAQENGKNIHETLSAREYDVLQLASAQSVGTIAKNMKLSVKTVSTYRNRILEKMGMHSNSELMRYALQQGLIH